LEGVDIKGAVESGLATDSFVRMLLRERKTFGPGTKENGGAKKKNSIGMKSKDRWAAKEWAGHTHDHESRRGNGTTKGRGESRSCRKVVQVGTQGS